MNLLNNGGFEGNLYYWTGSGTIERALGYPRLGCAKLASGQAVSQVIGLGQNQPYGLHLFFRPDPNATLTVTCGSVSQSFNGYSGLWNEASMLFALDSGANSGVTLSASGATVYVDGVGLVVGGLAITRVQLSTMIASQLSTLASDAGLGRTPTSAGPDGDYSDAIDEALRALGAVGAHGEPDVTALALDKINDCVEAGRVAMLQRLRAKYALKTDVSLGPRRESYSQIAQSIDGMVSGAGSNRRVVSAPMHNGDWPR